MRSDVPVGVLGGGAMGSGIAQVAALAGHPVVVLDVLQTRAEAAVGRIRRALDAQVARGRLHEQTAASAVEGLSVTEGRVSGAV